MKNHLFVILFLSGTAIPGLSQPIDDSYKFSSDITSQIARDTVPWKYQVGAAEYCFSGFYGRALQAWDKNGVGVTELAKEDSVVFRQLRQLNARDYIIQRSRTERLIIINEAHHNSRHRVFTMTLLQGLYDNGYRFLGIEALFDTAINGRKFATTKSGYYTKDPQFGNLIYEALRLGFVVFGYEAGQGKNGKEREIEQAKNIHEMISKYPGSKFLIHCGFDHVIEGIPKIKSWEKAMAGRLKEISGIDPLTIDQVEYSEKGDAQYNHPVSSLVVGNDPVVLLDSGGNTFHGFGGNDRTDCSVVYPTTTYLEQRPSWLTANGTRKVFTVPPQTERYPVLVLAYRSAEYDSDGIPADIVELTDSSKNVPLVLTPGTYTVITKDTSYRLVNRAQMNFK